MSVAWLDWSNPVAIWWVFLLLVSAVNIAALFWLRARYRGSRADKPAATWIEPLLLLCAVYVLGCAFRSVLPRADVQRICLFDTWLSSVMIGRSVATVAELCFAAQWAIVLYALGRVANSDTAKNIAKAIVPIIVVAEICSWSAVITTNFLGNVLENSLWTITFLLIGIALSRLVPRFRGPAQLAIAAAAAGIAAYVVFMATVDVRCISAAGRPTSQAARTISASSPACTTSRPAGSSPTTSRNGETRSPGCRFISVWRCGGAWGWRASGW